MMQNKNEKFPEDDFELEDFQKKSWLQKLKNASFKRNKKIVGRLTVLIVALAVALFFFASKVYKYYAEIQKNQWTSEIAREVVEIPPATLVAVPDFQEAAPAAAEAAEVVEKESGEEIEEEKPEPVIEEEKQELDKIIKLRETFSNDDIVGFLKIDDTNIDYAVVQSGDNKFYLERDLNGEFNSAGSIFMDYECDPGKISRNTVIYGHNMRNGSMFHNLRYYADQDFYEKHKYILLTTPFEETKWEVFSFYKTGTDFYYIQVIFPDDESFLSLVSAMKQKSMYDTGVEVNENDKILTLSTCSNTPDGARYVVNAKLISKH